jgi:hypothetical protein
VQRKSYAKRPQKESFCRHKTGIDRHSHFNTSPISLDSLESRVTLDFALPRIIPAPDLEYMLDSMIAWRYSCCE